MIAAAIRRNGARPRPVVSLSLCVLVFAGSLLIGNGVWIHLKAAIAQHLLERAFSETIVTGHPVKPWPWADIWPVARIEVPRLKQNVVALEGASGQALAFGPGHLANTSAPGDEGTSVFAAHRDTQFAFLGKLVKGDLIAVTDAHGAIFRYRVTGTRIVHWNASGIDPAAPGRHLALTTCWPFNALLHGPLRYVVYAQLMQPDAR